MARSYKSIIEEEWRDEDGYWIALRSGWQDGANPTCHTIHEDTKAEARSYLSGVVPCDCKDCRADKAKRVADVEQYRAKAAEHAAADKRCGRPWQCACGVCRMVRGAA